MKLRDLFDWGGTVDRGTYAVAGCVLFAIKYNVDRLVAGLLYGRTWSIFQYLTPGNRTTLFALPRGDINFFVTLVVVAIPFVWMGTVLTLKRLRSIGLPGWLVFFFFIPFVNLFFFLLLSVLPAGRRGQLIVKAGKRSGFLDRMIPDSPVGTAALALLINVASGLLFVAFSVRSLNRYGWGLFIGLPFCLGLTSVLIDSYKQRRTLSKCITVSILSVLLLGLAMFALAIEGLICLLMALPIAVILAILGGMAGYAIQIHPELKRQTPKLFCLIIFFLPLFTGTESLQQDAEVFHVTTTITINSPPEKVWKNVVSFSELPPPDELLFRMGVSYPTHAQIEGNGPGAIRKCVFSTGTFIEPITIWNEPSLLRFSVIETPTPMQEWSPYRIQPAHLHGFFLSKGGEFRLQRDGMNRTILHATTWYQHHMYPEVYWELWSDLVIHTIHMRVLNHIKTLSERSAG